MQMAFVLVFSYNVCYMKVYADYLVEQNTAAVAASLIVNNWHWYL